MFVCYCFVLLLMCVLCFCVLLVRDWVVASDVAFLRWFGCSNPKGLFGVLWNRLNWCACAWFSDIPGLLRYAGLKTYGLPLLWYLSVLRLRLDGYAQKSNYACCVVQGVTGTWIVIPCWRSIHSPIANLVDPMDAYSSTFFYYLVSFP